VFCCSSNVSPQHYESGARVPTASPPPIVASPSKGGCGSLRLAAICTEYIPTSGHDFDYRQYSLSDTGSPSSNSPHCPDNWMEAFAMDVALACSPAQTLWLWYPDPLHQLNNIQPWIGSSPLRPYSENYKPESIWDARPALLVVSPIISRLGREPPQVSGRLNWFLQRSDDILTRH
jgi:hypothetical protein